MKHNNDNLKFKITNESLEYKFNIFKPKQLFKIYEHDVILRSGEKSNYYIDFKESFNYLLDEFISSISDNKPILIHLFDSILEEIDKLELEKYLTPSARFFVGKGVSGILLVSSLLTYIKSYENHHNVSGIPSSIYQCKNYLMIIRDTPKKHGIIKDVIGLEKYNELTDVEKENCVFYIIDDVLSTGGTLKEIIEKLIKNGINKENVLLCQVIVSRNANIKEILGVPVKSCFQVVKN